MGRFRWLFLGAAVLMAALLFRSAHAGNVLPSAAAPPYQVYAVELGLGQAFTFVPTSPPIPSPPEALVIDDLTYSMQINPCSVEERCLVFNKEHTGPWFLGAVGPSMYEVPDRPGGPDYEWWFNALFMMSMTRWADARGAYYAASVIDIPAPSLPPQQWRIDAISHSLYGQVLGRTVNNGPYYTPPAPPEPPPISFGPGGDSYFTESLAATTVITQTSESRHFQTPYFQLGAQIGFVSASATPYAGGSVMIKGRIFFDGSNPPVRNTSFTFGAFP